MTTEKKDHGHNIKQVKLKEFDPKDERIVRCAGLKFLLPNTWKPGDVLDEESAALLNTAHHTLVLNRFGPDRDELLKNANTTYEDLDRALQTHFDHYKWTPRPASPPTDRELLTDEDKELIKYARPVFNRHLGRQGLDRKDYEDQLRVFVLGHKAELLKGMNAEKAAMASLIAGLGKISK